MQIITWQLGGQQYGLPLDACREVKENAPLYFFPHARSYVAGVTNFRGEPVPVLDIERLLNPAATPQKRLECSVVRIKSKDNSVALLVDSLSDIIDVPLANLEPPPANFSDVKAALVAHVAQVADGMIMILNPTELALPRS